MKKRCEEIHIPPRAEPVASHKIPFARDRLTETLVQGAVSGNLTRVLNEAPGQTDDKAMPADPSTHVADTEPPVLKFALESHKTAAPTQEKENQKQESSMQEDNLQGPLEDDQAPAKPDGADLLRAARAKASN